MNTSFVWPASIFATTEWWVSVVWIIIGGTVAFYIGKVVLRHMVKRIIKAAKRREWGRKDIEKRQKTVAALLVNVWRVLVLLIAGISLFKLTFPGFDLTTLFASAGIIGIALGLGAQSLIKDLLSGIFIVTENQYRVGDIIELDGASGTVERISTRSTVIRDDDGNVHYLPNGMITHVVNKTMGYSMSRFTIAINPASDLDIVAKTINTVGAQLAEEEAWIKKILEPPQFMSIGEFTGNSLEVIIAGKTQPSDQWAVTAEMRRRLLEAFEKAKIELATTV